MCDLDKIDQQMDHSKLDIFKICKCTYDSRDRNNVQIWKGIQNTSFQVDTKTSSGGKLASILDT